MAPATNSSKSASGGNPAPNFAVAMNQIQLKLEARKKAAAGLLGRSVAQTPSASSSGGFSSLNPTSSPATATEPALRRKTQAELDAEEAEFADERGLDPNAGIGMEKSRRDGAGAPKTARDRETEQLRGRLLGKRRGTGREEAKRARREESSDEEQGRSALGRAKRVRREPEQEQDDQAIAYEGEHAESKSSTQTKGEEAAWGAIGASEADSAANDSPSGQMPDQREANGAEGVKSKKKKKNQKKKPQSALGISSVE